MTRPRRELTGASNRAIADDARNPASLVAIAVAAHNAGDTSMKRAAVSRLRDEYGLELRFKRKAKRRPAKGGAER